MRKLVHSNVLNTTINITPTHAASGIISMNLEANKIHKSNDIAAEIPDNRPRPPEFTLIILCPIMAHPSIVPKKPETTFAIP
jgi:hypothetical protein